MEPASSLGVNGDEGTLKLQRLEVHREAKFEQPVLADVTHVEPTGDAASYLERFISSFFQEKNIKWMLLLGAAIVFGSSLMLVTHQWSHWPSTFKFLAILSYTIAIYGFGEFCRIRLLLTATGNVMHGLTLLLLPTCFLAFHWFTDSFVGNGITITTSVFLTSVAALTATVVSHRIFKRWLRASQPTFLTSYLMLCFAGALPTIHSSWLALSLSAILWGIASIGVVKVNRHVFWLTEENRWPRVYGFFPISLLTIQLIGLLSIKTLNTMPREWIGMGCVMMAATVFMTARTVANVFRQRSGDLIRPLPWSIVLPTFVGLLLTVLGVGLSFSGFSFAGNTTYAVVPTALVAGVLMFIAAYDTNHRGFVWAALILITLGYQCTPTLIKDLVDNLKATAAHSLNEGRLPVTFYGLTYLPLIVGLALASLLFQRKNVTHFSGPLKHFSTFLSLTLYVVAFGHLKAIFLVSAINILVFFLLAVLFRDRRYVIPALVSIVLSTVAFVPFANAMEFAKMSLDAVPLMLGGLSLVFMLSKLPDRLIERIDCPVGLGRGLVFASNGSPIKVFDLTAKCLAAGLTGYWFVQVLMRMDGSLRSSWPETFGYLGCIIALIWFCQTSFARHYFAGLTFWSVASVIGFHWGIRLIATHQIDLWQALDAILLACSMLCLLSRSLLGCGIFVSDAKILSELRSSIGFGSSRERPEDGTEGNITLRGSLRNAFLVPLCDLTFTLTLVGITLFVLPQWVMANLGEWSILLPISSSAAVAWLMLMAYVYGSRPATIAMGITVPLWTSAIATQYLIGTHIFIGLYEILPSTSRTQVLLFTWTIASVLLGVAWRWGASSSTKLGRSVSMAWVTIMFGISLTNFDGIFRLISIITIAYCYVETKETFRCELRRMLAWIAINIQCLYVCMWIGGIHGWVGSATLTLDAIPRTLTLLVCGLAVSIAVFDRKWSRNRPLAFVWTSAIKILSLGATVAAFGLGSLSSHYVYAIFAGHTLLAIASFAKALETKRELETWTCVAWALTATMWLTFQHAITFSGGSLPLVLIGFSIVALSVANLNRVEDYAFLFRPLRIVALALPISTCALVLTWNMAGNLGWNKLHTLALFCAAGLYFYESIHTKNRYIAIPALVLLNCAILIGWNAVGIHDFQFYMVPVGLSILVLVELLEKELPRTSHDPLRYVGALIILVSPVFGLMGGSWLHWISLLALCVLIILIAMGMRLRVLMYTGTAFLIADLVGMIIRSSIDNPTMLWVSGLGIGAMVIALAAYCEGRREAILAKIRMISCELATWR